MFTLSEEELARYQRQMTIPEWGEKGQEKLKEAKVVVAGAGGLGSSVLTYLAAAGIGNIRIIDSDVVDRSNLNRQILHSEKDIGKKKIDSAREKLATLNSNIRIETIGKEITEKSVFDLVADYPIVDALDNLPTRFLLNRAAIKNNLPLFHGAIYGLEGRATTIIPGTTPCLQCLYQGSLPGDIPVAGVAPGIIGCIQATEVIKYILDIGELLTNRLLVYDGLSLQFSEMKLKKNPNCVACK